jgi:hypothetical protein
VDVTVQPVGFSQYATGCNTGVGLPDGQDFLFAQTLVPPSFLSGGCWSLS